MYQTIVDKKKKKKKIDMKSPKLKSGEGGGGSLLNHLNPFFVDFPAFV